MVDRAPVSRDENKTVLVRVLKVERHKIKEPNERRKQNSRVLEECQREHRYFGDISFVGDKPDKNDATADKHGNDTRRIPGCVGTINESEANA